MNLEPRTDPAANTRNWWPWQVCAFLLLAVALSYLDRLALSVVAPILRRPEELGLDNADLGLLLSGFFWSFALMHLVTGWLFDRFNVRLLYASFVALWSLAQMLSGLSVGFGSLFVARVLLGAFETAGQTGAACIIARILPRRDRVLANGIMMSGGAIGAIVAGPVMMGLSNSIGWRAGFLILGGVGLVWAAAWYLWFRPPAAVLYGSVGSQQQVAAHEPWSSILVRSSFWACVAGAVFTIPIIHISSTWIPTAIFDAWGLSLDQGYAWYLFFIYLGLDAGFLGSGAAVSCLIQRGLSVTQARKTVMFASGCLMLCAAAVPFASSVEAAVCLIFLLNVGRAAWGAIFLSFNQDVAPGRVAMIAAIMGCIGALSAAILIWVIGILSLSQGLNVVFLMIAGLAVLGVLPVLLVRWDAAEPTSSRSTDLAIASNREGIKECIT